MSTERWNVHLMVTLNAKNGQDATERIRKAQICFENALRYADPELKITGRTLPPCSTCDGSGCPTCDPCVKGQHRTGKCGGAS